MRRSLGDLLVVDLTQVVSGAVTTMLMVEFGAQVIKIEPPEGEPYRHAGYPITNGDKETNLNFLRFSRGKKSVTLDLKSHAGRSVLRDLVKQADVLIENFRPGVLARLGFSTEELQRINSRLIYTSISGFGHDEILPSPFQDRPAYALITEAMAGLTHLAGNEGGPPVWMGFAMADIFAGSLALAGTLVALGDRERTGRGRRVDIAMYDGATFMNDLAMASYSALGMVMGRGQYVLQSPWGPFRASDGYIVIAVLSEHQWVAFCEVIGQPDLANDQRLNSGHLRSANHEELVKPLVSAWTRSRTRQAATKELLAGGVPAAPVNSSEDVAESEQTAARQMLVDVEDPVAGTVRLVGNPIKMDGLIPPESRRIPHLGEHNSAVLKGLLGRSDEDVSALAAEGAFGTRAVLAPTGAAGAESNADS